MAIPTQLEKAIYQNIFDILNDPENQEEIRENFPHPSLTRRNMGYAIDVLLDSKMFTKGRAFNFCKLLAGSEGTLAFSHRIKLNLIPLPPKHKGLGMRPFRNAGRIAGRQPGCTETQSRRH
jgi:hypothetical protein